MVYLLMAAPYFIKREKLQTVLPLSFEKKKTGKTQHSHYKSKMFLKLYIVGIYQNYSFSCKYSNLIPD